MVLVRTIPGGNVSAFLGCLTEGYVVDFRGPSGSSMLPHVQGVKNLVILVTGTGVSPIFSLLQHLLPNGFDRRIQLYWGLRLTDNICLTDEFDALAGAYLNFRYQISLFDPPEEWRGLREQVTESVPALLNNPTESQYILSGNGAIINEVRKALQAVGVPDKAIYREYFFNRNAPASSERAAEIAARIVS